MLMLSEHVEVSEEIWTNLFSRRGFASISDNVAKLLFKLQNDCNSG
jgi:hypothetical protein